MQEILEFFRKLTDSTDWPARWHCGQWTNFHGWLYILSDLLIWSAYFTIPIVILKYIRKKHGIPFIRLYFMFAAFILACGATHFLDAASFWIPLYRLNALMLFVTGIISWITVIYLVKFLPIAFSLKSQSELEIEIVQRKEAEDQVRKLNVELSQLVEEKSARNMSERRYAQKIRTKLQEEIEAKREEITDIFDRITDGFMVLDKNYRFTYVNKKIGEIVARESSSLIDRYIFEEFPAIVNSAVQFAFFQAMAEQTYQVCLYYFSPLDLWLENHIYPGPEGLSVFVRDMSKQKKAEIKIVQSEKIYRTIASSITGTIICLIDPEYRYQLFEGDMLAKLGYKKNDLLNQKIEDVLEPDRLAIVIPELKRVFAGEMFSSENRQMGYDLITRYVPLKDENNSVYMAMMVSIDVTELKNAQRSITELNINLEHKVLRRTEELAIVNKELEAFTYSVSHDLRAPLRAILGFTTILEEENLVESKPEAKRIMTIIKNSTLKMGLLIDSLLAFSRLGGQAVAKSDVDVQAMVNEILYEQVQQNGRSVISWEIGDLPEVFADVSTLKQVWINLISNAIKYSRNREQPKISIGSFIEEHEIVFFIRDNGAGFDNAYRNKLFGVFQRLHRADEFEGTGIGLALVSKIIFKHGGKVWAEGELDKGACFYFSLPQK